MNIHLMKQIDAVLGRLLTSILPPASPPTSTGSPETLLIIRPGGIGDAVLLAPTLNALKRQFPKASLTVLAEKRNADILQLVPDVDLVLRYDVLREFQKVFRTRYDVIIDTEQYHRLSAVVSRILFAGKRIGFATNERARLFDAPVPYSHDDYEVESFYHLLTPLGIRRSFSSETPFLTVPLSAREKVDTLLAPCGKDRFVVLFPGASIPERRWGEDKFTQVAIGLADKGYAIVVVGGVEDAACGEAIVQNVSGVNLAGKTTLTETAAVLERAEVLISGDSGVLHIGVGLGVPTVSLFGPGIARKWGPKGSGNVILNKSLSCSPCTRFGSTKPCQNGGVCLHAITAQDVLAAVHSLLQCSHSYPARPRATA
ncbi:MAG: glycosyltransferase family 9 protein [Desulfobulbus sp.]